MFEALRAEMRAHALTRPEEEVCGLIVNGQYQPCANVHSSPSLNLFGSAENANGALAILGFGLF